MRHCICYTPTTISSVQSTIFNANLQHIFALMQQKIPYIDVDDLLKTATLFTHPSHAIQEQQKTRN